MKSIIGNSEQVLSTRSVGLNLALPFNRGPRSGSPSGVAWPGKLNEVFPARTRNNLIPALKRRAKLIATLRVEDA
jgi:hypothetical protein